MTERTQEESGAIYHASRQNIYYNLLLDLRDLGYKPKGIVEITDVNPNTLRGQLYKARKQEPRSGLNFLSETLLNYLSVLVLLEKSNKNTLSSSIDNLIEQLKEIDEGIQISMTESDIEEKVDTLTGDMKDLETPEETPASSPENNPFTEGISDSTEEAPFGFNQDGTKRKIPPRKRSKRRR